MNLAAIRSSGSRERRFAMVGWRVGVLGLLALYFWPVSYGLTRLAAVGLGLFMWGFTLWLFGKHRAVLWAGGLLALALMVMAILPGRLQDKEELRRIYLNELQSYEGTRYVWGGENHLGIDCSGLVRCAFLNARCQRAVRTGDGVLLRETLASWWYDASARALQNEYRGETRKLFEAASIRTLDHARLLPGDFAVTSDGIHVLAYLGNETWIEADPRINKVIKIKASDSSEWLTSPADLVRWRRLE